MIKLVAENKYFDDVQEIHSFDAYYKNVLYSSEMLIVPYINLGVSKHPINRSEHLLFLNYAYMIFQSIKFLSVFLNDKRYKVIDTNCQQEKMYFGGQYLDYKDFIFNDMEIICEKAYLKTIHKTKVSDKMWQFRESETDNFVSEAEANSFYRSMSTFEIQTFVL